MTIFSLWPNSLTGHGMTTTWAGDVATQVDYEAELGVIIGRPAKDVPVRDALDYVWGYTVVNDITARDIQFSEAQWSRCKSFDGFTPTGPVVVTADEVADPQDLWLTTNVDGHILQDASTNEMVRSVAEIISYLSKTATLPAGTLISTGSPGGAGYSRNPQVFLHDGSTVTVTIEGIGSLTTHCRVVRRGTLAAAQGRGRAQSGSACRSTTLIACVIGATPDRRDGRSSRVTSSRVMRPDSTTRSGPGRPVASADLASSRPRRSR